MYRKCIEESFWERRSATIWCTSSGWKSALIWSWSRATKGCSNVDNGWSTIGGEMLEAEEGKSGVGDWGGVTFSLEFGVKIFSIKMSSVSLEWSLDGLEEASEIWTRGRLMLSRNEYDGDGLGFMDPNRNMVSLKTTWLDIMIYLEGRSRAKVSND